MILRAYQDVAIDKLRAAYASGRRAPCLVLPTGGGKTVVAAAIIRAAVARGRRVLFNAHRSELLDQTVDKLAACGITDVRLIQAQRSAGNGNAPVIVASVQTLARRLDDLPAADLIVFDECFPAGTLVDGRPIETIRVGDLVRSLNHPTGAVEMRAVKRLFCSRPSTLVTVHFDNGHSITCTAGHPFFNGIDYTPAINLQPGQSLYAEAQDRSPLRPMLGVVPCARRHPDPDLFAGMPQGAARCASHAAGDVVCEMRRDGHGHEQSEARWSEAIGSNVLLERLPGCMDIAEQLGDDGANKSAARERSYDRAQPDATSDRPREGLERAASDWSRSAGARRQWDRSLADGAEAAIGTADGVGGEFHRANEATTYLGLSGALQAGPGASDDEDVRRDRRIESLRACATGTGREETRLSRVARVDRIEVHERRGADGFGALCPDDLVYNLEVDGNHNYFVDGVLVHNCHHVAARTWSAIAERYAAAHILGMTATPQRADGKPIGDVFDALVVAASVRELMELGHLVRCRTWAPPRLLESSELAMPPVEAYERFAGGERAVVFCATVEHAQQIADSLAAAGHPAAVVHGSMAGRADTLARFRVGKLRAICNVHVLTEGWDDPGVAVCILARKPMHAGTFLQMAGRVLRPAPGKQHAQLIDLCGSVLEHGTPDADRTYALDGKAISGVNREQIRQCPSCGGVFLAAECDGACPVCAADMPVRARSLPRSVGVGVAEVGAIKPTRKWTVAMPAKFPGRCSVCKGTVRAGDPIYWAKGEQPRHEACVRAARAGAA